jgi:type IV pilus assembly protein PilX
MRNNFRAKQAGFVLAISMIFLIVMTMLAVTAIKKATMDEKVTGNLRAHDLAFHAAEKALRFCESNLELAVVSLRMCQLRVGSTIIVAPSTKEPDMSDVTKNFPDQWNNPLNWKGGGPHNATTLVGVNMIANVAAQPQCMIERWEIPNERGRDFYPYVITARGVGSVDTAVVWLQEVLRCGNN